MQFPDLILKRLIHGGAPSLTDQASMVLRGACGIAVKFGHHSVAPEHVLLTLSSVERVCGRALLESLGLDVTAKGAEIADLLPPRSKEKMGGSLEISPETERLLDATCAESRLLGHRDVGTEHVLLGLLSCGDCAATRFLQRQGITADKIRAALRTRRSIPQKPTATFIRLQPVNEFTDPAGSLDSVPTIRRAVMGLYALVSGSFFGLVGVCLIVGTIANSVARGVWTPQSLIAQAIGGGLLTFSIFLLFVWLRLWFGKRPWVDRMINRLFWRAYIFVMVFFLLFAAFGLVIWLRS